jgi:uncharacterized protein YwgA
MPMTDSQRIATIIADSGGRVVGRTRLQKIAYLLTVTGLESDLAFSYKHYGPYSEDVATGARVGNLLGDLQENEYAATWGGSYSIYTTQSPASENESRRQLAEIAAEADAIELELAATAVFLAKEGYQDPWLETARRKPEKAGDERLGRSKQLLRSLSRIPTPIDLPRGAI